MKKKNKNNQNDQNNPANESIDLEPVDTSPPDPATFKELRKAPTTDPHTAKAWKETPVEVKQLTKTVVSRKNAYRRRQRLEEGPSYQILVCSFRWVLIGLVVDQGYETGELIIEQCHVVRHWGTDRGLGQLIDGPREQTELDAEIPPDFGVIVNRGQILRRFKVREDIWAPRLASSLKGRPAPPTLDNGMNEFVTDDDDDDGSE